MNATETMTEETAKKPHVGKLGNVNAVKSGARVRKSGAPLRFGMMIGGGSKDAKYITDRLCQLRNAIEAAVLKTHGEVSLAHAAAISTALRWERAAALATKWEREQGEKMDIQARIALHETVATASEKRDRQIAKLGLDKKPGGGSIFAEIHAAARNEARTNIPPAPTTTTAPAATTTAATTRTDPRDSAPTDAPATAAASPTVADGEPKRPETPEAAATQPAQA